MPNSPETIVGLIASLLAGGLFLLTSLRAPRSAAFPVSEPADDSLEIYWPLLLGTGQRTFGRAMRLEIINQLATEPGDWRVPILLCARQQERDAELQTAITRALGKTVQPVISAPRNL